jgi:effector-binding domain-containing protein
MDIAVTTIPEQPMLGKHAEVAPAELPEFFGRAYGEVFAELGRQGVATVGPPVALYDASVGATADVTAGFRTPVKVSAGGGLVAAVMPGGRVVEVIHEGPYDALESTYGALMEWFAENGVEGGPVMWEEYVAGPPAVADPKDWRTRIVWPILEEPKLGSGGTAEP